MRRRGVGTGLFLVAIVLLLALPVEYVAVYFGFGEVPDPTPAQERVHLVTAGACLALMATTLVVAIATHCTVLAGLAVGGLVVSLAAAFVFSVPQGRWNPQPAAPELPANYDPCFSGSQCGADG